VTQSIKGIIKVCGAEEAEDTAATKKAMKRKQENDYHVSPKSQLPRAFSEGNTGRLRICPYSTLENIRFH
jgi:hypothetical protein